MITRFVALAAVASRHGPTTSAKGSKKPEQLQEQVFFALSSLRICDRLGLTMVITIAYGIRSRLLVKAKEGKRKPRQLTAKNGRPTYE